MREARLFGVALAILIAGEASALPARESAKSPTRTYLDYHAAVSKAKTLSEVLPYLSAAYRRKLESRPKKDHPVWLEKLREAANVKDLKIVKETIADGKCALEGTATSARGNAVNGKVYLVREGGAWKIDQEFWAT
jgi:hypothetical protein